MKWTAKSPKIERLMETIAYYVKRPDEFNQKVTLLYNKATDRNENLGLPDITTKMKAIMRMVKMTLNGTYQGLTKNQIYIAFAVFAYLLSPLDLIPDFLPVIGFVDDAALILWLTKHAINQVEKFEQWEANMGFRPVNTLF
jgi:uncharacterized membrane protein YkvA (DUF1232 family)